MNPRSAPRMRKSSSHSVRIAIARRARAAWRGALESSARVERRSGNQSSSARSRAARRYLGIAEPSAEPSTPSTNPISPRKIFPLLVLPISPLTDPHRHGGEPSPSVACRFFAFPSAMRRVAAGTLARAVACAQILAAPAARREPRRDGVRAGAPRAPTPSNPATGCPAMCFPERAPRRLASRALARAPRTPRSIGVRRSRRDVSRRVQTAPRREAAGLSARTHAARRACTAVRRRVRTRRRATIRGEGPRRVARASADPPHASRAGWRRRAGRDSAARAPARAVAVRAPAAPRLARRVQRIHDRTRRASGFRVWVIDPRSRLSCGPPRARERPQNAFPPSTPPPQTRRYATFPGDDKPALDIEHATGLELKELQALAEGKDSSTTTTFSSSPTGRRRRPWS